MVYWLGVIWEWLIKLLSGLLPTLIREGKKPREVKPAGFDKELQSDVERSIEEQS